MKKKKTERRKTVSNTSNRRTEQEKKKENCTEKRPIHNWEAMMWYHLFYAWKRFIRDMQKLLLKKKPIFVNNLSIWELWVLCTRHINDEMRFKSRFSKTNTSMVFTRQHIIINGNNIAMNGSALTRHMPNMPCENSFSIINKELLIFCLYSLLYGTK